MLYLFSAKTKDFPLQLFCKPANESELRGTSSSRRSECHEAAGWFVLFGRGCCHGYGGHREGYVGRQKRSESGGETKRGLNEATVKASDEIQDELDESDHAEMLKRYDRRNNKFCQIRSNVSYQFKPWRYWTQPTPSCCAFRSWQSISHWNCEVADRSSAIMFGGSQLSIFKYESFKHFLSSPVNLTSEVRL